MFQMFFTEDRTSPPDVHRARVDDFDQGNREGSYHINDHHEFDDINAMKVMQRIKVAP